MAIDRIGRATSLAFSATSGSATGTLSEIQAWSFMDGQEIEPYLLGQARVTGHYKGQTTATLTVTTSDLAWAVLADPGDSFTSLVLTVENAIESDGTAVGGSATITFSRAVLTEKSEIGRDNANSSPVDQTLTFVLSRSATGNEPTAVVAASA